MKKILLVTDGIFHPPFAAVRQLHKTLAENEGLVFKHVRSMEQLPEDLLDYAALVLYFHHKTISQAALKCLEDFVSAGGGVLGVHSATASFKQEGRYFDILGGRFVGHGVIEQIEVKSCSDGGVFPPGLSFPVFDELYFHEMSPDISVHFATIQEGEEVPVVWTNLYGRGKVCYVMPGHTVKSMKNPAVQKILQEGLNWVCGE
jgi:uncharacterized protein